MDKTDIRQLSFDDLSEQLAAMNLPAFRARQVYSWLWEKSARSFFEMSNLSKDLRAKLDEQYCIRAAVIEDTQKSNDGTMKSRIRLWDGELVESVLIPVPSQNRYTLCVSSQVGCSLSCAFCATGLMDRVRNLDAGEIYDQYVLVNAQCMAHFDHPLTNVVYMGMGEPLLNYKNVLRSTELLTSELGLNISPKRITVSTVGIAKMIRKLGDDEVKFNLALSLHAPDDDKRSAMMAINDQNSIKVLMESIQYFYKKTGNRISYEYIAFDHKNDTPEDVKNLTKLCKYFPVKVNIIEYNRVEGLDFTKSDEDRIDLFAKALRKNGVMVTLRRSRGKDIDAACGQLIVKTK